MLSPADLEIRLAWANIQMWHAGQRVGPQRIASHSLWLVLSGEVLVQSAAREWRVGPGEALFWPAGHPRLVQALGEVEWLTIGWRVLAFGHLDAVERLGLPRQWKPAEGEKLRGWMMEIMHHRKPRDAAEEWLRDGLARVIFATCWRELAGDELTQTLEERLPAWVPLVGKVARERPEASVAELAREAGISPAHLRREFSKYFPYAPHVFLARQRLESARRLLETTDLPVRAVAARTGYASASHFARLFKQGFGVGPDAYRKNKIQSAEF